MEDFMGLPNRGNTCYLNAVLVSLFYNPSFDDYFREKKDKGKLVQLMVDVKDRKLDIEVLITYLQNQLKKPLKEQRDPAAFYSELMELLKKESSDLVSPFAVKCSNMKACTICKKVISVKEVTKYWIELPPQGKLEEILLEKPVSIFKHVECENCGFFVNVSDSTRPMEYPPVIHLKPVYDEKSMGDAINFDGAGKVRFPWWDPEELKTAESRNKPGKYPADYKLFGIIFHMGTKDSGHCVFRMETDSGWVTFDDSSVGSSHLRPNSRPSLLVYIREDTHAELLLQTRAIHQTRLFMTKELAVLNWITQVTLQKKFE